MKILMDGRALGTKPSGIGIYIYTLLKAIMPNKDYAVSIVTDVCVSDQMKELQKAGAVIYEYGQPVSKNTALLGYYRFVQECIHSVRPDVFWEGNTMIPVRTENPYGVMIATIHDMFPLSDPEHFGKVYPHYFRFGIQQSMKYFDAFVFNSVDTQEQTFRYFPKMRAIPHFVGYIVVPRLPELPVTDNGSFLYIGNMETRKGTDILLEAYRIYRERGGQKGLRLAGKIREDGILKQLEELQKTTEGIQYLGYISEEEKAAEYAACSCFVFPSRAEGFGIPIVEVMNYNKPVIAGDLETLREIVGSAVTYTPVHTSYWEAAVRLAEKMLEEIPERDPAEAQAVVDRYSEETIAKGYCEFLDRCVKKDYERKYKEGD